jgi:GT2 family glycosyltransferase
MNTLAVIIPTRTASNLIPCLEAVCLHQGPKTRVIIVDDGLEPDADQKKVLNRISKTSTPAILPGKKPFIFARNVNIGIQKAAGCDVVILNDDAILKIPGGFSLLQKAADEHPEFGVIASTTNNVGNVNQHPQGIGLRDDPRMVCFVCVLIPRRTVDAVGMLDERFVAYGGDDNAYCKEIRKAGLKIGIHDDCYVDHSHLTSTFRGRGSVDISVGLEIYKSIYGEDYQGRPVA